MNAFSKMTKEQITSKIAEVRGKIDRGFAYLKENHAGFHEKIDVYSFNIGDCCRCVFGQLVEDYLYAHKVTGRSIYQESIWYHSHGFHFGFDMEARAIANIVWKRRIAALQNGYIPDFEVPDELKEYEALLV